MKAETIKTLVELGFPSVASKIETRKVSHRLNLDLTIKRNGNVTIIFCNGGQSEYDLLANHGAVRRFKGSDFDADPEIKSVGSGSVPYLTIPTSRLKSVLQSIAFHRLWTAAKRGEKRCYTLAQKLAAHWFAMLPDEENALYNRDIACDEFENQLASF